MEGYFEPYKCSASAPIFKAVEAVFDHWIKNSNPANEYKEMYFGEDAIYTKRGAIVAGIEAVMEYMWENKISYMTTKDFYKIDFAAIFE
jgi:hypothetical protein